MDVSPGTRIADKFEVEAVVGRGGMGFVVRARHLVLDQAVAIKFLNPRIASIPEAVHRFVREARAATRVTSEHVARVLDVATLPDGEPYMVMEYLEGQDLDDLVEALGPVPLQVAVDYVLQASIAIAEAHAIGIVHRDLKPSNLFLTHRSDGRALVKVLDFGISKVLPTEEALLDPNAEPGVVITQTAAMMGSPLYTSPEQLRLAKGVTAATDIWALGVILYLLVSGRHPFEAPSVAELCAAVVADPPTPLARFAPRLPAGFEAIVMRCLAKAPEARWPDVAALAAALEPFADASSRPNVERIQGIARSGRNLPRFPDEQRLPVLSVPPSPAPAPQGITSLSFELAEVVRKGIVRRRYFAALGGVAAAGLVAIVLAGVAHRPSAVRSASASPSERQATVASLATPPPAPAPPPAASPSPSEAEPAAAAGPADAGAAEPALVDDLPADEPATAGLSRPRRRARPPGHGRRYGGRE